jgi:aspartate kinase
MTTKVAKFGGTSMADAAAINKSAEIILSDGTRRFAVVSAPGKRFDGDVKVTDLLYRCHEAAADGGDCGAIFDQVRTRFNEIVADLRLNLDLNPYLDKIIGDIRSFAGRDYAASRGEFLSGLVMAARLDFEFIDAADIIKFKADGSFDDAFTNDVAMARLSRAERGAVIPGFYGRMPDGSIKTFSRGGSDVTGSIIARAAGARLYENWTDVDGFLTCDPKIVNRPRIIDELTYRELRELSYMGAAVMHPDSIFPVRGTMIPINVRNTFNPTGKGTMIVPRQAGKSVRAVTGIAGKKGFISIFIEKSMMNNMLGFARRVLSVFEHYGVSVEHMPSGIDTLSLVVEEQNLAGGKLQKLLDGIVAAVDPDALDVIHDLAIIATVGHGMARRKGTAGRLFSALAKADVNIMMIDQGSSELNIIVGVTALDFEKAITAVYEEFFVNTPAQREKAHSAH